MAEFESQLAAALARGLAGFDSLASAARLTGGASQETWRLEVVRNGQPQTLCLRRSAGSVDAGKITPAVEARLLQVAGEAHLPVPDVLLVLAPEDGIGEGFVMSWLEGETLGGRISHSRRFAEVRPALAGQCGEILARLHAIDYDAAGLSPLLPAASPEALVRATWEQYQAFGSPQPMIDYAARWLLDHLPPTVTPALVHGDFRNGNLMVSEQAGVIGVLDWELAGIGDPLRDLGWLCTNSWRFGRADLPVGGFGGIDDLLAGYESVSGQSVDREHLQFWTVFGSFWWSVCCLIMADSYRSGDNRSVERPAIGRRASEGQADCVALLIPGAASLPSPAAAEDPLPRAEELLGSVAEFLVSEVAGELPGAKAYLAKVAANSVAIAAREAQLGPALLAAESERLAYLPGLRSPTRTALAQALRDGLALDTTGLAEHLRSSVFGQLSIDQPGYRVAPNLSVCRLWEEFLKTLDASGKALVRGFESNHFCDNQADADSCAALVLAGRKRATASAQWRYEAEGLPLPAAGEYVVVTDWAGNACCVICTTRVDIVPFNEVSEEFAAMEGEGDGSLAGWREAHWAFFSRELAQLGMTPSEDMPVVCERFEKVYP